MADEEAPLKGGDGDGDGEGNDAPAEKKESCGDLCEKCIIGTSRVSLHVRATWAWPIPLVYLGDSNLRLWNDRQVYPVLLVPV